MRGSRRGETLGKILLLAILLVVMAAAAPQLARAQPTNPPARPAASAQPAPSNAPATAPTSAMPGPAAGAQPTPQQLAEAKKYFDAGKEFLKKGANQEALAAFLEAYRLAPRESIARNIAQTQRELRDYAAAYAAYEEVLAKFSAQIAPADLQAIQHAMSELEAFTGTIDVMTAELQARISIDGHEVGRTPLSRPIRVNIGTHNVSVTKEGFEPVVKALELHGHDVIVISDPLVKESTTGHVIVSVVPATQGAVITIDNVDVGAAPAQADVPPGKHVVSARMQGMAATPQEVDVQKKGTYEFAIALAATDALLTIVTATDDAEISLDGVVLAKGKWEGRMMPGPHALIVKREGFQPYQNTLQIKPGEHTVENVVLVAVAPPPPPPKVHDWNGGYQQFRFAFDFGVNQPTNDIAQGKDYSTGSTVATGPTIGGDLDYRFGQSFGPAGVELGVYGLYRHAMSTVNVSTPASGSIHPGPTPRVDDYEFHTLGMGIELGARFMPRMQDFRPTVGLAGGIGYYLGFFNTSSTQDTSATAKAPTGTASDPAGYFVPRISADAGILIGTTPGTRFFVAMKFLAEFPGAQQSSVNSASANLVTTGLKPSTAKINITNGTDIILGPIIGAQWGE